MTPVGHSSKCTRVAVDTTYTYTFPLRKSGPGVGGRNRSSYVGNNPQPSETLVV
jgi:hypothetical protein